MRFYNARPLESYADHFRRWLEGGYADDYNAGEAPLEEQLKVWIQVNYGNSTTALYLRQESDRILKNI